MDEKQMSVFDVIEGGKKDNDINVDENLIEAIEFSYKGAKRTNYDELFDGFDELRVITFSVGLGFVTEVMKKFRMGEIIIGCDMTVTASAMKVIANQEYVTEKIKKDDYLVERIKKDEFQFYVSREVVSHQKIYLLKSYTGRYRVILGSANMSRRAWDGTQIENIAYCDEESFYSHYIDEFELLKKLSTNHISIEALMKDNKNIVDKIPMFSEILKTKNAMLLRETKDEESTKYEIHIENISKKYEGLIPKANKEGRILIKPQKVEQILGVIKKNKEQKQEIMRQNPQFVINYNEDSVMFNDKLYDLNPDKEDIINDINNLITYMDGFDNFTGDTYKLKESYYKILNYMFLSPFIAKLRYVGDKYDYDTRFFPLYGLLYGPSDAGKTKFVYTVWQLMFGKKLNRLTQKYFTASNMVALKESIKGIPILIDEMSPKYFQYAPTIVKIDDELIKIENINHPAFLLVSNDIKGVKPEISKRMFVINIDNRVDKTEAAYNSRTIEVSRKKMHTAFYREYLRRMFIAVDKLIEDMKVERDEDSKWYPDIFSISSKTIIDILKSNEIQLPKEFKEFTWEDYFGEDVVGEKAKRIIETEWKYNKDSFIINRDENILEIDFKDYEDKDKKLEILYNELPAKLECHKTGSKIILKLDVTEDFLNTKFKKKFSFFNKR